MRIALLAPLVSPIAPPFLGGAQALLADLATGLAARGHAVTLYAADGSHVPGVATPDTGIDAAVLAPYLFRQDADSSAALADDALARTTMAQAFARVFALIAQHAGEHDLLHAHAYDWAAFMLAARQPLPVLHTLHLPNLDPAIARALATLAPVSAPANAAVPLRLATVSQTCAASYASVCRIDAVLYNGIETARIPFGAAPADPRYLLFAARMSPEKGVEDAIAIARRAGRHLMLAGGVYDEIYFAERVAPLLAEAGDVVTYVGQVARERLWDLMAGAEAALCLPRWDEPFGLVACEAQAAGTPVVGYARGGLREVVQDGATGRLVAPGDIPAAAAAIAEAVALDRRACRALVEQRFSLPAMLDAHERFYKSILA